ncbi:hypothetical protein BH09ACT8_BH09ACT8_58520 [soil metagenome]
MSKPNAPARRAPDDDAVAWELAAAAHPHLSRVDADRIYIAIGVGDTFEAIDALLTALARDRIPLNHDVVATVASWLDCYRGQDAEVRLRHVLAESRKRPTATGSGFRGTFRVSVHRGAGPSVQLIQVSTVRRGCVVTPSNRRAVGQAYPTTHQMAPPLHRL